MRRRILLSLSSGALTLFSVVAQATGASIYQDRPFWPVDDLIANMAWCTAGAAGCAVTSRASTIRHYDLDLLLTARSTRSLARVNGFEQPRIYQPTQASTLARSVPVFSKLVADANVSAENLQGGILHAPTVPANLPPLPPVLYTIPFARQDALPAISPAPEPGTVGLACLALLGLAALALRRKRSA